MQQNSGNTVKNGATGISNQQQNIDALYHKCNLFLNPIKEKSVQKDTKSVRDGAFPRTKHNKTI
jgi:hypothetical protein